MAYPGGFTYALGKLDQAIEELEGAGEIKERLDAAGKTLAPIFPDDFPEPLRTEYASIHEALTWLPGDETRGTAETTLAAMTDEEASSLAQRLVSLYTRAEHIRGGSL
jgi:hypothetical protein